MLLQTINHNNIPTSLFSVKRPRNKFHWTICTYFLASAFYKHWLYLTKRSVNHRCKTPSWGLLCNWLMCICASWTQRKYYSILLKRLHFLCYDPWLFRATHYIYVIFDNNILHAWTLLRPARWARCPPDLESLKNPGNVSLPGSWHSRKFRDEIPTKSLDVSVI